MAVAEVALAEAEISLLFPGVHVMPYILHGALWGKVFPGAYVLPFSSLSAKTLKVFLYAKESYRQLVV